MKLYDLDAAAKVLKIHRRTMFSIINRLGWTKGPLGRWRFTEDDLLVMARGKR